MSWPTVNQMLAAIERRVCVRKLWRCNAGWGMSFIPDERLPTVRETCRGDLEERTVVYAYYDTLTACVRAEYAVWVKKLPRPWRTDRVLKRAGGSR